MRLELSARVDGQHIAVIASVEVPELYCRAFEPIETHSDALMSMAFKAKNPSEIKIIMKTRDDAEKILSEKLAEMLVNYMKQNDTHNGYEAK